MTEFMFGSAGQITSSTLAGDLTVKRDINIWNLNSSSEMKYYIAKYSSQSFFPSPPPSKTLTFWFWDSNDNLLDILQRYFILR